MRTAILISGRGSNMQALLDAASQPAFPAEIVLVGSNRPNAAGLQIAKHHGVETIAVDHKRFRKDREAFERALDQELRTARVELVCLAGFMRILTPWFTGQWSDRLINIHPSLLPAFKGLDTHQQALDAGVSEHGCTVHFVRPEMDTGPIIDQARVPVIVGDDAESLAARVLEQEHRLYPHVLGELARGLPNGTVRVDGERVIGVTPLT
ncbi:MAG: phosphoribosylglycinamide formyltransferase [Pseudomonadota bacterium]